MSKQQQNQEQSKLSCFLFHLPGGVPIPAADTVFAESGHHYAASYRWDRSKCCQRGNECLLAVRFGPRSGRVSLGQYHLPVFPVCPAFPLCVVEEDPRSHLGRYVTLLVHTWGGWTRECFQEWSSYTRLAIPSMFMVCIEWWTFEIGTFLAGLVNVTELGAQAVIYELASVAYMVPFGFGVAASVRVGNALGAGNAEQARRSCTTVLLCAGVCALLVGILLAALKDVVAYIFTNDKDIISLVSQVMPIFAPFHLFDALAGTCGGVLRGTGKQKIGAILNAIGYYGFGFPIGVSLMFAAKLGIIGLWSGLVVCVFSQALSYLIYIRRMNWNRAAEQAQVRAGLKSSKETIPTPADLPILERDAIDGVILPDIVRPEGQAGPLVVEESQHAVPTVGEILTGRQLIIYRGLALAASIAVLIAGIVVRVLNDRG
uniref:multidrug and toxin extrusion protein 2 isoform X1 n=1 Tax=Myodes glareolus TaxID=447135 RepID=UPI002020CF4C|nr:multidrug and toxin extrusion protein 2 isoform X1 [Myodes glareolus]